MKQEKKTFEAPVLLKEEKYQTAHAEHCHQVKPNDCDYPAKA